MGVENLNETIQRNISIYGENLYHYTSLQSAISILRSKELWARRCTAMNDALEFSLFLNLLKDKFGTKKIKCNIEDFEEFDNIPYVFCLSKRFDDAAQWERYADRGRGVCLIFDVEELTEEEWNQSFTIQQVKYIKDIEDIKDNELYQDIATNKWIQDLEGEIVKRAIIYKHIGFESEQEIRLVFSKGTNEDKVDFWGDVIQQRKSCRFNGKIIKGIIIGPRSTQSIEELKK